MDNGEFEKISDRLRSCFCQFISTVPSYIHSQNFPNMKTYLYIRGENKRIKPQSLDRRLMYFLMLSKNRWTFSFSFKISKSWPATETTKLHYTMYMYLPARLISVPWGTTKADKRYRFPLDLFTAAVDLDGWARTKKTPSRLLPIQTSRSVHPRWKQSAFNDNTLSNIVLDNDELPQSFQTIWNSVNQELL